jgi:hypothetical protein
VSIGKILERILSRKLLVTVSAGMGIESLDEIDDWHKAAAFALLAGLYAIGQGIADKGHRAPSGEQGTEGGSK